MSCGLRATSPPKRRKLTPGSLASGIDCLCASQKSAPGERSRRPPGEGCRATACGFESSGRSVDSDSSHRRRFMPTVEAGSVSDGEPTIHSTWRARPRRSSRELEGWGRSPAALPLPCTVHLTRLQARYRRRLLGVHYVLLTVPKWHVAVSDAADRSEVSRTTQRTKLASERV